MRVPLIDGRDVGRIIEQLLELAPYYVPEWNTRSERDPAAAVIRIFAGQYVDTLERLNRVPDKNFMTFLSKLGISLLPATQARAPVTFRLSSGVKDAVLIPARTQVAAPASDGGKPIVFETRKPMLATPARIIDLLCAASGADAIYNAPPGLADQPIVPIWAVTVSPSRQDGSAMLIDNAKGLQPGDLLLVGGSEYAEVLRAKDQTVTLASPLQADYPAGTEVSRVTSFKLFEGLNKQEHWIYIAHEDLLRIGPGSSIRLTRAGGPDGQSEGGASAAGPDPIRWQYWDGGWIDLRQAAEGLRTQPGTKSIGLTEVNGELNRWLRGQVPLVSAAPEETFAPPVEGVTSAGNGNQSGAVWHIAVTSDNAKPDLIFGNNNPVEPDVPFYLFGTSPRTGDTLYLSSADALSKKGGTVTLVFVLPDGEAEKIQRALGKEATAEGASAEDTLIDLVTEGVSWEYWNGSGWLRWDRTEAKYDGRSVFTMTFRNSGDVAPTAVQGQESYWIRCRLYALPVVDKLEVAGKKLLIRSVSISSYAGAEPEQTLEYRSLRFRDAAAGSWLSAADALDSEQAMYVGFDRAPLRGPISVYLSLADQVYDPDLHPFVEWQYYAEKRGGSGWVKLDAVDGTDHLTRSGCLEFVGLPDWTETAIFGKSRYWMRAVDKAGVFQGAASGLDSPHAPAPIVHGVYRNTTIVDQAESYKDEVIGSSRGTPNTAFAASKVPVAEEELYIDELSSISDRERLTMLEAGTPFIEEKDDKGNVSRFWVRWSAKDTLTEAAADERCYAIDRTKGLIRFGDGIHGKIPPIGTNNVKLNYRSGGGTRGNVEAGAIGMLKSSIAYVDGVTNPGAAAGGYDTEDNAAARERGPLLIKHRFRAVTAADYENLVFEAARGIARAKCLPNVNELGQPQTGRITLLIVPQSAERLPQPSAALRQTVESYIREHAANVVAGRSYIHIRGPAYAEVSVHTVLVTSSIEAVPEAEREAHSRLKSFLHPLTGGPVRSGWEFGRIPALSDLYVLLGSIPGLEYVDRLEMQIRDADGNEYIINPSQQPQTSFPQHLLIYSGSHQVVVRSLSR